MIRLIPLIAALLSLPAGAQTTLDITVPPGNVVCSYVTGPVTSGSVAGHLQATATSSSGAGCGSGGPGNVTFGPATPLTATPSTVPGTSGLTTLSFQALNATQCTGAITGTAAGTFTGGNLFCGTGGASCSTPVSKTASFINGGATDITDTVTVTCTGPSGQAQSSAAVKVSGSGSPPPNGCQRTIAGAPGSGVALFTQQTGKPVVRYNGVGSTGAVDITQFSAVFPGAFPGDVYGQTATDDLPIGNYISMKFIVTPDFVARMPDGAYYSFSVGLSDFGAAESYSISTTCGDFSDWRASGSTVVPNCRKVNLGTNGRIPWYVAGDSSKCVLSSGGTYYWNIINANVTNVTPTGGTASSTKDNPGSQCSALSCPVPIYNGPNPIPSQ